MEGIIKAILMGVVEGLTEFIPVSSTGHLIMVGEIIGFTGQKAATFEIAIQLGAILSIVFLYRDRFTRFLSGFNIQMLKEAINSDGNNHELNLVHVAIAILPVMVVGFFLHGIIKQYLFSSATVVVGLIIGGIIMIGVEQKFLKDSTTISLDSISYRQALGVGLAQCCALWPGVSRSGATIVGGLLMRMDHRSSAEFSFLIAVPVMFVATIYDLLKSWSLLGTDDLMMLAVGFTVSFICAWLSVVTFLKILSRWKLSPFGWYRIGVACLFYLLIN
jgi:undecaprenyl-diphosphatase